MRGLISVFLVLSWVLSAQSALSDKREFRGTLRLFSNDYLGDRKDRWRTGAYQFGALTAPAGADLSRLRFGEAIEYRIGAGIITPSSLVNPPTNDRAMVGIWSLGVHSYHRQPTLEVAAGLDLVFTGPDTGWGDFLDWFHNDKRKPSEQVLNDQIGNGVHPTGRVELVRPVVAADNLEIRPFAELQAGVETFGRLGVDLVIGMGRSLDPPVRDSTTGHLLWLTRTGAVGQALVLGADFAYVSDSVYLPDNRDADLEANRWRARAGGIWRGSRWTFFYGAAWLAPEFEGQPDGQLLGSIHANYTF